MLDIIEGERGGEERERGDSKLYKKKFIHLYVKFIFIFLHKRKRRENDFERKK